LFFPINPFADLALNTTSTCKPVGSARLGHS
jgi:hypothetical protein